jgi:uncharacterized protein with HEPN domain
MSNKDYNCLQFILEAATKIEKYTAPFKNADEFYQNQLNFEAAMMNFVVIGEMVDKISQEFKQAHSEIDWTKIKDFRNLIAHDYLGIDAEEVWEIIKSHLVELKDQVKKIIDG